MKLERHHSSVHANAISLTETWKEQCPACPNNQAALYILSLLPFLRGWDPWAGIRLFSFQPTSQADVWNFEYLICLVTLAKSRRHFGEFFFSSSRWRGACSSLHSAHLLTTVLCTTLFCSLLVRWMFSAFSSRAASQSVWVVLCSRERALFVCGSVCVSFRCVFALCLCLFVVVSVCV